MGDAANRRLGGNPTDGVGQRAVGEYLTWAERPSSMRTFHFRRGFVTDRELIQACIECREEAWETFLERYTALIYHVIWKTLRNEGRDQAGSGVEVEDVCAEVLSQVVSGNFRMLREFEWRCKFSTWLSIVTYRTCLQAVNRVRHGMFSIDDETCGKGSGVYLRDIIQDEKPQALAQLQLTEAKDKVLEALTNLPARDQLVLKLFYFEGKKYSEIGEILDMSASLVGTAIFRAKLKLAEMLQPSFSD